MRRASRVAVAALGAVATMLQPAPAAALGIGEVVYAGGGMYTPGLLFTPQAQSLMLAGTAVGTVAAGNGLGAGVDAASMSCAFSGTSKGPETVDKGQGTIGGSCSGASVTGAIYLNCPALAYDRWGLDMVLTGTGLVSITTVAPDRSLQTLTSAQCTMQVTTISGGVVFNQVALVGHLTLVPTTLQPIRNFLAPGTLTLAGA